MFLLLRLNAQRNPKMLWRAHFRTHTVWGFNHSTLLLHYLTRIASVWCDFCLLFFIFVAELFVINMLFICVLISHPKYSACQEVSSTKYFTMNMLDIITYYCCMERALRKSLFRSIKIIRSRYSKRVFQQKSCLFTYIDIRIER